MLEKGLEIVILFLILLSISTLFLSDEFFIFDIFSHFQLHYVITISILSFFAFYLQQSQINIIGIVYCVLLFIFFISPLKLFSHEVKEPDVFFMNTLFDNKNSKEVSDFILQIQPKVIALTEINQEIKNELTDEYGEPYIYHEDGGLSCAIFSKEKSVKSYLLENTVYPICVTEFENYTLVMIHPIPPFSSKYFSLQQTYFGEINTFVNQLRKENKKFLLVGDFNSTIYSGLYRTYFGDFKQENFYTWSSPGLLMLPLDHALSNIDIHVSMAPKLSSDHRGLFINFVE